MLTIHDFKLRAVIMKRLISSLAQFSSMSAGMSRQRLNLSTISFSQGDKHEKARELRMYMIKDLRGVKIEKHEQVEELKRW